MSYCEFCLKNLNECACPMDLTEPRLETELAVADNIMASENPHDESSNKKRVPSPNDSFSLLKEIENVQDYKTPMPINIIDEALHIPKLERKTNKPEDLCIKEQDLNEVKMELFPEEQLIPDADFEDFVINVEECHECNEFICVCNSTLKCSMPDCNNQYNLNYSHPYYEMCFDCEMKTRKQELIDELLYPDDIPMELRYNSDRDSF